MEGETGKVRGKSALVRPGMALWDPGPAREWENGKSNIRVPPRPDLRDTDFIFFVIGDWEIVIGKKQNEKCVLPPARPEKMKYPPPPDYLPTAPLGNE